MGWSGWSYVDTNMSIGKYRLWYRTHDNWSTNTVALQYEVEVEDTGSKTERWNCYVCVSVDGVLHSEGWSNYKNSNTTTGAGSTVPGHTGYITGYTCIGSHTVTKGISGTSASWTLSLAGGFTAVSRRDCTCTAWPSASYYYTNGTAPSITTTDNGNNTATMSGYLGSNGTNNGITGSTLYWTTNGSQPSGGTWYTPSESMGATSGGWYSKTIDIPNGCNTIWAVTYCSFTFNQTNTGHQSKSVKYYTAPGNPGKPVISYTKSRLTIKENWTFSWSAAGAGNSNSPVKGYRIRLYKNGVLVPIKDYSNGNTLSTGGGSDYWYDRESTSCSIVIDPIKQGFLPGDRIQLGVYAYARNGAGSIMWSGGGSNQITSDVYTVQNAGVMRPLYNGQYREGQVFACVPNGAGVKWVEADIVKTCISPNNWVEAE